MANNNSPQRFNHEYVSEPFPKHVKDEIESDLEFLKRELPIIKEKVNTVLGQRDFYNAQMRKLQTECSKQHLENMILKDECLAKLNEIQKFLKTFETPTKEMEQAAVQLDKIGKLLL